ncbi:MAG TPA: hypothetical protein V6C84_21045 [Coleofasciculaceae cyanobacterium]|jgi:hypothetical protein
MSSLTIPEQVLVWKISGKPGNVKTQNRYSAHSGYNLLCQTNQKYLTYVKASAGVNLGYITNAGDKKVHFRLPDNSEGEILTGQPFALGIGGNPSFLKYARRTVGINLEYSAQPVFEWRIYDSSGELGKQISTESPIAIVNEQVEPALDFLVYLDRPAGADVGWTTSPKWWDQIPDLAVKAAILAAKSAIVAVL